MKIGNTFPKIPLRYRLWFAAGSGLLYTFLLWLMGQLLDDFQHTPEKLIFQGVFFGLFFGLGFPSLFFRFGKHFAKRAGENIKADLEHGELIEAEGPANLFRGLEAVGGKLFLTNSRLIFKSHRMNIQTGQTSIHYNNIQTMVPGKSMKWLDNRLKIITGTGKPYDFVLHERDRWIEVLEEMIARDKNNVCVARACFVTIFFSVFTPPSWM